MKCIRKILAVVLCLAMLMTVCVPFASAEELAEDTTEITQETPEPETPEESEEDTVIPDEPEEDDTYPECLVHCLKGGLQNISNAGLFAVGTVLSPIMFFVFPPGAVTVGIVGLPASTVSLFVGIGEIIASPILAFFFDTNDYMGVFNRKENSHGSAFTCFSADVPACSD